MSLVTSPSAPGRLKQDQIGEFYDRGFVVVRQVFPPPEMARIRAAFVRLEQTALRLGRSRMHRGSQFVLDRAPDGGTTIKRIVWCGAAEPILSRYGSDPRLIKMAALLLGSRTMSQLINQAHFKLPQDGVEFPWHQDSSHRRFGKSEWRDVNGRGSYVQTLTAVDEVTPDNGPLLLIPGSSRLGHLDLGPDQPLPESVDPERAVAPTLEPGDVLVFGPYTLHRSLANSSDRPRRVFINGFAYPGANSRVYPGDGAGRTVRIGMAS